MPVMANTSKHLLCLPVSCITSTAVSSRYLPDACTSRDLASPADDPAAPCLSFPLTGRARGLRLS